MQSNKDVKEKIKDFKTQVGIPITIFKIKDTLQPIDF